ncbi:hypothetical protein D3C71_1479780 [compost metagenome]
MGPPLDKGLLRIGSREPEFRIYAICTQKTFVEAKVLHILQSNTANDRFCMALHHSAEQVAANPLADQLFHMRQTVGDNRDVLRSNLGNHC